MKTRLICSLNKAYLTLPDFMGLKKPCPLFSKQKILYVNILIPNWCIDIIRKIFAHIIIFYDLCIVGCCLSAM